ncbi:hypothetical protein HMN09_00993700 [Mycena chlorophos]|uniref:Uncharacterized protein n=1 Tax=Mycena chlorophos TaxID=658473 RepID=A0A8H6W1T5_MYCCL|nr:hypothetical protein HMN09_00993700 [Mycena chlorophos]
MLHDLLKARLKADFPRLFPPNEPYTIRGLGNGVAALARRYCKSRDPPASARALEEFRAALEELEFNFNEIDDDHSSSIWKRAPPSEVGKEGKKGVCFRCGEDGWEATYAEWFPVSMCRECVDLCGEMAVWGHPEGMVEY